MVDLILLGAIGGAFYGGFKAGNKYRTFKEFFEGMTAWWAKR